MKLEIPEDFSEITLAEIQEITKEEDLTKQVAAFFKVIKADVNLFKESDALAVYQTALSLWAKTKPSKPLKEINGYKLPSNLIDIRVGHLIELANIELNDYEGAELVAGCFYRKDWSKPFDSDEIIETAYMFRDLGVDKSMSALLAYQELMETLRDLFPVLYNNKGEDKEEGRKMYSMLLALSKDDATKWDAAKSIKVSDAFTYLETKEIEFQKQKKKKGYI
mgnify:CR=1 FL=1